MSRLRRDFTRQYPGPACNWPGPFADTEPDWTSLFPVPPSRQVEPDPPAADAPDAAPKQQQQAAPAQQQDTAEPADHNASSSSSSSSDDDGDGHYSDDGGDFWLSPRNACALYFAACTYHDEWIEDYNFFITEEDEWPVVVWPYMRLPSWRAAYLEAIRRIICRLAKGQQPQPNCTAEEYALHKVIGRARAYWDDDFLPPAESLALLPCRDVDGDFLALTEYAFDDHDATPSTVLWDHPELINASELHEYMGTAKLHPEDWFWAFKDQRAHDHVL